MYWEGRTSESKARSLFTHFSGEICCIIVEEREQLVAYGESLKCASFRGFVNLETCRLGRDNGECYAGLCNFGLWDFMADGAVYERAVTRRDFDSRVRKVSFVCEMTNLCAIKFELFINYFIARRRRKMICKISLNFNNV